MAIRVNEQGMVVEQIDLPTIMIHQSFRYVLGRRSHAVSTWVDWAVENWDIIPDREKGCIIRELEEEFDKDDKARREGDNYNPLGPDMHREEWQRIRNLYQ